MDFKKVKLKEIATIYMGQSPKGSSYNNAKIGIPFLQGNRTFGGLYPLIDTWTTEPSKIAKKNSILMSVRAPVGALNIANEDICIGRGLCSIEMINGNNQYLYYLLKNSINEIKVKSTGTVFDSINRKELEDIEVLNFNETQQNKIANILFNIDSKIELNNKINDTLYTMGKVYYNYYFKQYDFTKEFKNSEIGKIPKEYEIKSLSEVTMNNREKVKNDLEYKVLSAVKTGNLQLSEEYFSKNVPSAQLNKYIIVKKDDFAYNPARINIGSIGRNEYEYKTCVSPVYVSFTINNKYKYFWDFYFKDEIFKNEVITRASGSVRQTLKYDDFGLIKIVYPNEKRIEEFNFLYEIIDKNIKQIKKENAILENIKNILLPKLMNGEIDLDKIEI